MKKLSLTLSSLAIVILFSFSFSYSDEKNITKGKAIVVDGDTVKINGKNLNLKLYGKVKGKAGTENTTELPPPFDKELFFGTSSLQSNPRIQMNMGVSPETGIW